MAAMRNAVREYEDAMLIIVFQNGIARRYFIVWRLSVRGEGTFQGTICSTLKSHRTGGVIARQALR